MKKINSASKKGHDKVVKSLSPDERVNITANNNAIRFASLNEHIKVVKLLLEDKRVDTPVVDTPVDDNWPTNWPSFNEIDKVVELFLKDKRVNPTDRNN